MIYIIKQEGWYQNKVNSSLVSTCDCKIACLRITSSSETQGEIVGARESLNGRFSARLDSPSPPLSPPGSPRMGW